MTTNYDRLLHPRHIAVFGGHWAHELIRQCNLMGYAGEIWPVHPNRDEIEGRRCFRSVGELPEAPDTSFVAVPREISIDVVRDLAERGAGSVVCFASGFAEVGEEGAQLQRQLIEAAGDMPLVGPNCYGMLNCLDRAPMWPEPHGMDAVESGVAIISQSGNVGVTFSRQQRSLPIAYLLSVGNLGGLGIHDYIDMFVDEPGVNAIGLYLEGLKDIDSFSRAAIRALERKVPLVVLKTGSSEVGAQIALSHTSSLTGSDALNDALFAHLGIARVGTPAEFIETLKFLSVVGPLPGKRIGSISCSGGEATLVADIAQQMDLDMPVVSAAQAEKLGEVLGPLVSISNPLDYHTFIWGDAEAQENCFTAMLEGNWDVTLKLIDFPAETGDDYPPAWTDTAQAFLNGMKNVAAKGVIVSGLPESIPPGIRAWLLAQGVAPMQGLEQCLTAIRAAAWIGEKQRTVDSIEPLVVPDLQTGESTLLDEWESKQVLSEFGLTVPLGRVVGAREAQDAAAGIGYPVVIKAVSSELAHKTEAGGVRLGVQTPAEVEQAVANMQPLSDRFLIEKQADNVVAELIVGVTHNAAFGHVLVIGAGGVLVELIEDSRQLFFPVREDAVRSALDSLKISSLMDGFRGKPAGDKDAVVRAVMSIANYVQSNAECLLELDVNPLLVLPQGQGAVAVDALIRLSNAS